MTETPTLETTEIIKHSGMAIGASLVVNILLFFIADGLDAFEKIIVPPDDHAIGFIDVFIATSNGLVVGTIAFLALIRFRDISQDTFRILVIAGGALTLLYPLTQGDAKLIGVIFLELMHVSTTAIFVYFMTFRLK